MKPKKPSRLTKCVTCREKLGDKKAINCQLCAEWACLPCTELSEALHDFCQDNAEAMAFLCKDCKLEIPSLKEMKNIKLKQQQLDETLTLIRKDITTTNVTIDNNIKTVTDLSDARSTW